VKKKSISLMVCTEHLHLQQNVVTGWFDLLSRMNFALKITACTISLNRLWNYSPA